MSSATRCLYQGSNEGPVLFEGWFLRVESNWQPSSRDLSLILLLRSPTMHQTPSYMCLSYNLLLELLEDEGTVTVVLDVISPIPSTMPDLLLVLILEGTNDSSISWLIWKRKKPTKPLRDHPLKSYDQSEEWRARQDGHVFPKRCLPEHGLWYWKFGNKLFHQQGGKLNVRYSAV